MRGEGIALPVVGVGTACPGSVRGGGIFDCIGAWAHDKLLKSDDDASNDDVDVYYYNC